MTAHTAWVDTRRVRQLSAAAADGMLHYAEDGTLMHRRLLDTDDDTGSDDIPAGGDDIPASSHDTALVADLVTIGHLRRDPATNTVTSAGAS